jgi:hypothetical protein
MNRQERDRLLEKLEETLRFDITHLYQEAASGKLSAASAKNLVDYLSHLTEQKDIDPAELADDELEKLVQKVIDVKGKK